MKTMACALTIVLAGGTLAVLRAQHPAMPSGMTHEAHLAQIARDNELKKRGAAAMEFDQETTAHHFRLTSTGGWIEVVTKDPADVATRDQIRAHLREIAADFARGNFAKPFETHGEIPPGVATMQARNDTLAFTYEALRDGGIVRIATTDATTRNAVHDFLRYQIREHATGDPKTITR